MGVCGVCVWRARHVMFLFCLLKFYINMSSHSTHSRVWILMFPIIIWKSILVVVKGPKRTSKEFSWTWFASFIMSWKIKLFTISDDDQVLELFGPLIIFEDQFYVVLCCLLEEGKNVEWPFQFWDVDANCIIKTLGKNQ